MKKIAFYVISFAVGLVVSLFIGELLVRSIAPQVSLFPHYQASNQYGLLFFPSTKMRHTMPGLYDFTYTVNQYGYRGEPVPISNKYVSTNIVVLGDSYSFGTGVNDGEEYSAVMRRILNPRFEVINLAVIGFGLTQEIRRFYEYGVLFDPKVVILQFCRNDPSDIAIHRVTTFDGTRFHFVDTKYPAPWLQSYLANSPLQRSQLFNFFRIRLAAPMMNVLRGAPPDPRVVGNGGNSLGLPPLKSEEDSVNVAVQRFYGELLAAFAVDLRSRGIRFLMISVNGELELWPRISGLVKELHAEGLVEYVEVLPWFEGMSDFQSPEGHIWGTRGHSIIGVQLAAIIAAQ